MPQFDITERYSPGARGEVWYEHWHRYHFLNRLAVGKRVLDVACGEGYGTALLAQESLWTLGIDLSALTVATARRKYATAERAIFASGDCAQLPLADASIDIVFSFETLEHMPQPNRFLSEVSRVLTDNGVVIVSTPNRPIYNQHGDPPNPFHTVEFDETELRNILSVHFKAQRWFGQSLDFVSILAPHCAGANDGQTLNATPANPALANSWLDAPKYFVCVCAKHATPIEGIKDTLSLLSDSSHFFMRDYRRVLRETADLSVERDRLKAQIEMLSRQMDLILSERNRALFAAADCRDPSV